MKHWHLIILRSPLKERLMCVLYEFLSTAVVQHHNLNTLKSKFIYFLEVQQAQSQKPMCQGTIILLLRPDGMHLSQALSGFWSLASNCWHSWAYMYITLTISHLWFVVLYQVSSQYPSPKWKCPLSIVLLFTMVQNNIGSGLP